MKRALCSAGFQAIREPPGVNRGDGLRPDGMTRAPWPQGRSLVWDVTVVDTVAQSYVKTTKSTADQAEEFKMQKYRILSDRYHFKPLGFETFGSWGQSAVEIIGQIGRRIGEETGEPRSLSFLRQRISIEIRRGNAASVFGTFKFNKGLDEIFGVLRAK